MSQGQPSKLCENFRLAGIRKQNETFFKLTEKIKNIK